MNSDLFPKLSPEEDLKIKSILADPEKKYKLFKFLQAQLGEFEEWFRLEEKRERLEKEDKEKISFLRRLISRLK